MIDAVMRGVVKAPEHRIPPPDGPGQVDALARFGRLASVGQSAEAICYDMADLLSAIQGRCDLALANADEHAQDDVRRARGLAMRCAAMVRRLVSFTQGQSKRWSASLQHAIDRMETYLSLHNLSDTPMRVDVPQDVRVACPPTQLQQVLQNLVLFARDTIGAGAGKIDIRGREHDGHVTIEIAHSGPGILASVRRHLFDPFAAPAGAGVGLELYIARVIVEDHGGMLGLFSSPDRGTTFRIVLPCVAERAPLLSVR